MWKAMNNSHENNGNSCQLVMECTTARKDIATAVSVYKTFRHLLVGDSRGVISVFEIPFLPQENPEGASVCSIPIHSFKAHCIEPVSQIICECFDTSSDQNGSIVGVYSIGHDGNLNVYVYKQKKYELVARMSTFPITSPDTLVVTNHGSDLSVYVGGFQASVYQVWDIRKRFELCRFEAGSWK